MAGFDITGEIVHKGEVQQITETFKKREFVIEVKKEFNGNVYSDFIKFQMTQDRVGLVDDYQMGNNVRVSFNIRGNKYTSKKDGSTGFITNLEAWRIERMGAEASAGAPAAAAAQPKNDADIVSAAKQTEDDLPF